jgi:two-component system LytT family response regulator
MTDQQKLRVIIVDDEPLAREKIRSLLRRDPEVEVIEECADGEKAVAAIQKNQPDLLFLDVQMPVMDGFTLLQNLDRERLPSVIFVTAYDKYALRAFEVYALDYLLKPFDRERFQKALQRAKLQIRKERSTSLNQGILALIDELRSRSKYLDRLVIKNAGRIHFIKTDEIDWIEAEGNYVRLHTGKESHLLREPISSLEVRLNPRKFLRIHRSTIVSLDRIHELQPWFHGEYRVILKNGTQLMLSRSHRDKLNEALGRSL